jgi:hypothetical protein
MRKLAIIGLLLFQTLAYAQSDPSRALDRARDLLKARQIGKVVVLRIPDDVMTGVAVTPDMLRKSPSYTVTLTEGFEPALGALLVHLSAKSSEKRSDLRWGMLLIDNKGNEISSVFVDHFGTTGYVNDQSVEFDINMRERMRQFIHNLR